MFKASGRNDVVIQWMSRDYLKNNRKEIENLSIMPGEQALILRKGTLVDVLTETQIKLNLGLWKRFADCLFGSDDLQLLIIDVKSHEINMPFEAFSKDHVAIRGTSTIRVNVSDNDLINVLRLLKEDLKNDQAFTTKELGDYREVTLSDLVSLVGKNLSYTIDTEFISKHNADELNDKRVDISSNLVGALNSKTPYWVNYGLWVSYSSLEISENLYEESINEKRAYEMEQKTLDNQFFKASCNSEHRVRLDEIEAREKANYSLNEFLANAEMESSKSEISIKNAHLLRMSLTGYNYQEDVASADNSHRVDLKKAYNSAEVSKVIEDTKRNLSLSSTDLNIKIKQMHRDTEFSNLKEEKEFELQMKNLESEMKLREIKELASIARDDEIIRYKEMESHREKMTHEANLTKINGDISIKTSQSEKDAISSQAELKAYKEASENQHRNNVENNRVLVDGLAAANQSPRTIINNGPQNPTCANCGTTLDVNGKFCGNCGVKIE